MNEENPQETSPSRAIIPAQAINSLETKNKKIKNLQIFTKHESHHHIKHEGIDVVAPRSQSIPFSPQVVVSWWRACGKQLSQLHP